MSIQGSFETFSISEIFQLISQQGKTGTLEVEDGSNCARVRFLDGKLVEAWADDRAPSEFIGAMLVRAALITPAQLEHALEVQRQSLRPLGDILLRMGALRVSEFQEILTLQHRETLFRLLVRKKGNFSFRDEPVEMEEGVSVLMDTGALLMEGFRQIDEWPRLRDAVPSEAQIMLAVREPGEDLSPEEGLILSLVDGVATVRDVVDRSRLGDFAGWTALARLLHDGVIAPLGISRRSALGRRRQRTASRALDIAVSALALLLSLAVLMGGNAANTVFQFVAAVTSARQAAQGVTDRASEWDRRRPPSLPNSLRVP